MLRYSKEPTADILHEFECGIPIMDDYIHRELNNRLRNDPGLSLYVVRDEADAIVAMYVVSTGSFVDYDGEYAYLPQGKPWGYIDSEQKIRSGARYTTLEIEYIAVRRDMRNKGYGSAIIKEIARTAKERALYFLTLGAYHDASYSAIPFYEKLGFFALQEYSEKYDTLRMALRV